MPAPLQIALDYHDAWTSGRLEQAWLLLDPDVGCRAPAGLLTGRDAVAGFMGPFAAGLTGSRMLASFGDDERALLLYDTTTVLVPSAPAAELYEVVGDRIRAMTIVFDRLPFALARGAVAPVSAS